MTEPKLIGYTEREDGFDPLYDAKSGSIVTQAFITCKHCCGTISPNMGPRSDAVCLTCYEVVFSKEKTEKFNKLIGLLYSKGYKSKYSRDLNIKRIKEGTDDLTKN